MSELLLDEISPRELREKRLDLALDPSITVARAFNPIVLSVSYTRTLPDGVMLPLLLEVQGPSPQSYQRRVFGSVQPRSVLFVPREGGSHLVTLREVAHKLWWGSLQIDVVGELLNPPKTT
jgi:hypothetical protein